MRGGVPRGTAPRRPVAFLPLFWTTTMSHSNALQATSTYYGAHAAMRLVRAALGATERLWPALAVRAADRKSVV